MRSRPQFGSEIMFYKKRINSYYLSIITLLLLVNQAVAQPTTKQPAATTTYPTDGQVVAKGQQLFQQNCATCHNFLQKGIGPNLASVTSEATPDWLKSFIRNAPSAIERGDARATKLFAEYKQYMPPFTQLSDGDTDALLAYIHSRRKRSSIAVDTKKLGDPVTNPIPSNIKPAGLRLHLSEVMTAPPTAEKIPLARLNKMQVIPGKPNRLFLEDLRGTLYEWADNSLRPFMSMPSERPNFIPAPGLATGFGSYAFHPDFQTNGLLYTSHTEKAGTAPADFAYADSIKVTLQWVLTEWKVADPTATKFSGTGRELMRIDMVSSIHGMQEITFNPLARPGSSDYGLLYVGIGDGGCTENGYYFLCKDRNRAWGKVLRIDPKGKNSKNGHYGIPANNPYANDKAPNALREVFCQGFRNPNRITWTPDGKMLITDIGQAQMEEVNVGVAGANYGWPEREGTFVINHQGRMDLVYALPANDATFKYTYPVVQYDHDDGNAISGGFVYTGTIPTLAGKYIFGDVVNGRVYFVDSNQLQLGKQALIQELIIEVDGKNTTFQQLSNSKKTDLRFGVGLNQEFYLYTKADGKIYKISDCTAE